MSIREWSGEESPPGLDPEAESELERLGAMLRRRSPVLDPELDRRIIGRIRRSPRARFLALRAWWLRPRNIVVSPLSLLGAGASAAVLLIGIILPARDRVTTSSPPGRTQSDQTVQFSLTASGVSRVNLVGDFNGWDQAATPLRRVGDVWVVEVPLAPGRHEYAFVLDGREWRPDPAAPPATANDFDSPNSVITVGAYRL